MTGFCIRKVLQYMFCIREVLQVFVLERCTCVCIREVLQVFVLDKCNMYLYESCYRCLY